MLGAFLREPDLDKCKSLQRVFCSGEALSPELVKEFFSKLNAQLHNLYGPTEAAIEVTYWECRREDASANIPIGHPISNTQMYVLNERLQPVPARVAGELYIGGVNLGRGYLRQPALTAEKFIPNPFSKEGGARIYRTGDRARYLPEGQIEFLGRVDQQVKIRGYRIELGEIEGLLAECSGIREAVVVVRGEPSGDKRLVAYVVPRSLCAVPISGTYELPNGMHVFQQNKSETDFLYDEIFVSKSYLRRGMQLPEKACIVDVGANIGMFVLFAAEMYPQARIYAFEPILTVFETLSANGARCSAEVKTFPFGLGKEEMIEEFTYYPDCSIMSGPSAYDDHMQQIAVARKFLEQTRTGGIVDLLSQSEELQEGRFERQTHACRIRRLSEVIAEEAIEHIDLLKIDVERAEIDVLQGIDADDWFKIDRIVMSAHDMVGAQSERVRPRILW
jgi:FkbM family methyltransferase